MPNREQIVYLSASQTQQLIAKKELSPVEVVKAYLAQIEEYNPIINAICTLSDRVLPEARAAEQSVLRGGPLGLLHGLPVGLKDITPTAGLRTTFGSPLYEDYIPQSDAVIVQRLKTAGAIILGKTNTPEFAVGASTFNQLFGPTRNPWNPERSPGGSTGGGAAALAAGMIALADGTDLGGSLRIPAAFCGVVGLRPSPGLVPIYPANYLWDTLNVAGPIARTAADVALMLQAIAGPSPHSPLSQPIKGRDFVAAVQRGITKKLRLAYVSDIAGIGVDPDIERVCRQASFSLADERITVEEIEFDLSFAWQPYLNLRGYRMVAEHYPDLDKIDRFGDNLANNLKSGLQVTMTALGAAETARSQIWQKFYSLFENFDHLLTPCAAIPPFSADKNYPETIAGKKMNSYIDWIAPTFLLSLTGLPVGCVPSGLTGENLPVGLQIVGRPQGEEAVLALAQYIQHICPIGRPSLVD